MGLKFEVTMINVTHTHKCNVDIKIIIGTQALVFQMDIVVIINTPVICNLSY
jgi:hypothetical protein